MRLQTEIERDAKLTPMERLALGAICFWPLFFVLLVAWLCGCGCKGVTPEGADAGNENPCAKSQAFPQADKWWK